MSCLLRITISPGAGGVCFQDTMCEMHDCKQRKSKVVHEIELTCIVFDGHSVGVKRFSTRMKSLSVTSYELRLATLVVVRERRFICRQHIL